MELYFVQIQVQKLEKCSIVKNVGIKLGRIGMPVLIVEQIFGENPCLSRNGYHISQSLLVFNHWHRWLLNRPTVGITEKNKNNCSPQCGLTKDRLSPGAHQ